MSSPPCTNVKSPRTNVKPPYWRLSGDGSASHARDFSFVKLHNSADFKLSPFRFTPFLTSTIVLLDRLRRSRSWGQGVTRRARGTIPRALKSSNDHKYLSTFFISTFFNTVHFLQKDLRFEHGGAKPASCPGRHLTLYAPGEGATARSAKYQDA